MENLNLQSEHLSGGIYQQFHFFFSFFTTCISFLSVITNYHKFSGLNITNAFYNSGSQKPEMGLIRVKPRCWQDCVPFRGLRGEFISLPFLASRTIHVSWPVAPSSIFQASNLKPNPSHVAVSLVLSLLPPSSTFVITFGSLDNPE